MCLINAEEPLRKVRRVESEKEKDDEQLKQATERAAVLQDELILTTDREIQLEIQLDKMKDDVKQLRTRLEHQSKEFDDFKQRSAGLWEQELKRRDSRFIGLKYCN